MIDISIRCRYFSLAIDYVERHAVGTLVDARCLAAAYFDAFFAFRRLFSPPPLPRLITPPPDDYAAAAAAAVDCRCLPPLSLLFFFFAYRCCHVAAAIDYADAAAA